MRRREHVKASAGYEPPAATGVRWPRGGPRPAPPQVPGTLRYLAAWCNAREQSAVRATLEELAAAGPLLPVGMSHADRLRERLALPAP